MSTHVVVNTYSHSVTYVTDKLLSSMKLIIRLSGLSPEKLTSEWSALERGVRTWLGTRDLEEMHLEVYDPDTDKLIGRWDFEIHYGFQGDGDFWVDPDAIKYSILKQGTLPSSCRYEVSVSTKPGRPDVDGWCKASLRSTEGFVRQSIGTVIEGSGLSGGTSYWRRVG